MTKLAFYYDSLEIPSNDTIENLKKYLFDQNTYDDFIIFTNIMFSYNLVNTILPTFYSKFFNGHMVFFDIDDYMYHNHNTNNFLYVDDIDKFRKEAIIGGIKPNIILYNNQVEQNYRIIYEHELQQTI